jgi:hypothetical protein
MGNGWTWPGLRQAEEALDAVDAIDWERVTFVVVPCDRCGEPMDLLGEGVVPERPVCC